jgi:hypothetical protein
MASGGSPEEGFGAIVKALQQQRDRYGRFAKKPQVSVVYTAPYAVYVHENLEIEHPQHGERNCGGQAKFLEQPLREGRRKMGDIIRRKMARKRNPATLEEAMVAACEWLLKESQKLVPVDTGELKESGQVIVL